MLTLLYQSNSEDTKKMFRETIDLAAGTHEFFDVSRVPLMAVRSNPKDYQTYLLLDNLT